MWTFFGTRCILMRATLFVGILYECKYTAIVADITVTMPSVGQITPCFGLCPSVSYTCRRSIKTAKQIELVWGMEACHRHILHCKGKGSPYSITKHRVLELIPVLGSHPADDVSHKPGCRLPLLYVRPAVTLLTSKRVATNFAAWRTGARWM